jgi:hypothetical protein
VSRSVAELRIGDGLTVRTMFNREDSRANEVWAPGTQVLVDDLTRPHDVVSTMRGAKHMVFTISSGDGECRRYTASTARLVIASAKHT